MEKLNPEVTMLLHNNRGWALQNMNRIEEAGAAYTKAWPACIDLGPHHPCHGTVFKNVVNALQGRGRRASLAIVEAMDAMIRHGRPASEDDEIAWAYNKKGNHEVTGRCGPCGDRRLCLC